MQICISPGREFPVTLFERLSRAQTPVCLRTAEQAKQKTPQNTENTKSQMRRIEKTKQTLYSKKHPSALRHPCATKKQTPKCPPNHLWKKSGIHIFISP